MIENQPRRYGPLDVGPWIVLPAARLILAMTAGAVAAGGLAAALTWVLSPTGITAVPQAVLAAVVAHSLAFLSIRPWSPRFLGQWPFAVLRATAVAFLLVLVFLVLVYSATRPDPVVLGLAMVGAWFGGLLSLVMAYGSYVKGIPLDPTPDSSTRQDAGS